MEYIVTTLIISGVAQAKNLQPHMPILNITYNYVAELKKEKRDSMNKDESFRPGEIIL